MEQDVTLPGIDGAQTAVYTFGEGGLEGVSVIIEAGLLKAVKLDGSPVGSALSRLAGAYFDTDDPDEMMRYTGDSLYYYKSVAGDAVAGYIPSGRKYDLGVRFFSPASFDQSIFRDDALYTMTTEPDGTLDYNAASSRPVTLNIDEKYKIKVAFTSGVQMFGAGVTPVNSVPRYRVVFVYFGLAEPAGVNTLIFTVDNRLFQFTIPANSISGGYKSDSGLYRYQYSLLIGAKNREFMEALLNAEKEVKVELRGNDFSVAFPFIEKAITPLAEDWENFKRASGLAPLYVYAADETPLTIY